MLLMKHEGCFAAGVQQLHLLWGCSKLHFKVRQACDSSSILMTLVYEGLACISACRSPVAARDTKSGSLWATQRLAYEVAAKPLSASWAPQGSKGVLHAEHLHGAPPLQGTVPSAGVQHTSQHANFSCFRQVAHVQQTCVMACTEAQLAKSPAMSCNGLWALLILQRIMRYMKLSSGLLQLLSRHALACLNAGARLAFPQAWASWPQCCCIDAACLAASAVCFVFAAAAHLPDP